jgi:hypothetical protein
VCALSRAALGLIVALSAPATGWAQAPDASRSDLLRSGAHSVPGWWASPGRPGWLPDTGTGDGYMWTLAGLVAGAWSVDLAGRDSPAAIPPGAVGAQESSAWFDTIAVTAGEGAAWDGYDATLAQAAAGPGLTRPGRDRRPRSDLLLSTGTERNRDNALSLWRGDSLGGVRAEATSGSRGPAGALVSSERDMYQLGAATGVGHNSAEIVFAHRRSSASLAGGELQQVTDESGSGGYEYRGDRWRVGVSMRHAHDQHESFLDELDEGSLRLATRSGASVEIERRSGGGRLAVRGDWNDTRVITAPDTPGPERARALWGAVRWTGPFVGGQLNLGLGVGQHDAIGGTTLVPSLAWSIADAPLRARLVAERVVTPVWSDLAAGRATISAGCLDRRHGGGSGIWQWLAGHYELPRRSRRPSCRDRAAAARSTRHALGLPRRSRAVSLRAAGGRSRLDLAVRVDRCRRFRAGA